ncbi:MAG TPA: hypothetical protein VMF08_04595 [Candidatus Sulfotelmatobacter sp.]|nr:hypothetical protein [Candidatus Sulfotelmatobacter sp.]
MNTETPNLEIRIHKLDGSVSSFAQDDFDASKQILDGFNPMDVFSRPRVELGDRNTHTVIPVSQITRIDLDINEDSRLVFPSDLVEAVELMPEEFETLVRNLKLQDQWKHLGELDAFVVTFLNAEMADGRGVLLTMEVDSESPQGLCELRDFLLSRSSLCFRASGGGIGLLNLANLSCLTIFPGAHPLPSDAWHARRFDERWLATPEDDSITDVASGPRPAPESSGAPRVLRIKRL